MWFSGIPRFLTLFVPSNVLFFLDLEGELSWISLIVLGIPPGSLDYLGNHWSCMHLVILHLGQTPLTTTIAEKQLTRKHNWMIKQANTHMTSGVFRMLFSGLHWLATFRMALPRIET